MDIAKKEKDRSEIQANYLVEDSGFRRRGCVSQLRVDVERREDHLGHRVLLNNVERNENDKRKTGNTHEETETERT